MIRFLISFLKLSAILLLTLIVVSRLFFSSIVENQIISPVRQLPVFGKVLGATWDASGEIGPVLTLKTVDLADRVEYSDLGINETIEQAATDKNIGETVSEAIELQVKKQVSLLKNTPKEILEKAEQEIRDEMYRQICSGWKKTSEASTGAQTN